MKSLSFLLVTLVACAGAPESVNQPAAPSGAGSAAAPKPTASGDVSFDVPAIDIKGAVLEPEALGRPGMPLVEAKKKITVDKQRALVISTKDLVQKQAQAAVLATMLYLDAKTNKANEKALLAEARQVLRDVAQQAGDKAVDEITLRLLGSYELLLEDYPAAEKAWQTLIEKDPKAKETPYNRAWLAYSQLKQFKNAEALATATADKYDDKQPELAYVTAWAKWRNNDAAGAWQALNAAAKSPAQNFDRDDLERDFFVFAARGNVPLDQAQVPLTTVLAKAKLQQGELIAKLGVLGYGLAGRWAEGVSALDKALEVAGDGFPPSDRVVIRYSQADYAICLDNPDAATAHAKQAIEALAACGAKCTDRDNTVMHIYNIGRLFHNLYATANDRRYYQPAHDLYAITVPLFAEPARSDAQKVSDILEKTFKNTKVGTGTHDKGTLGALLNHHNPEIQSCYEAGLGTNPKLGGSIALNLESDATGVIKGISTEPKAGLAEMPAVAACVAERAKQWKLPKRGMPGTTRIKMRYTFAVAAAKK
jgi:tetratricopeptide (TPR) repeat protein